MKKIMLYFITLVLIISLSNLVKAQNHSDIAVIALEYFPHNPQTQDILFYNYTIINYGPDPASVAWMSQVSGPIGGVGDSGCCVSLGPNEYVVINNNFILENSGYYVINASAWVAGNQSSSDPNIWNNQRGVLFYVSQRRGGGSPIFKKALPRDTEPPLFKSPSDTRSNIFALIIIALFLFLAFYIVTNSIKNRNVKSKINLSKQKIKSKKKSNTKRH